MLMQFAARGQFRKRATGGFTAMELLVAIAVLGILSALAVPNFIRFQARSKQSEAKANLKALYTAEKAYFQEKDTYNKLVGPIGFSPERGNRYTYYLDGTDTTHLEDRSGTVPVPHLDDTGISADLFKFPTAINPTEPFHCGRQPFVKPGPTGAFIGGASGNIDNDATQDQWTVASFSRANSAITSTGSTPPPITNQPGTGVAAPSQPPPTNPPGGTGATGGSPNGSTLGSLIRDAIQKALSARATLQNADCDGDAAVPAGEPENDWNDVNR